MKKEDKRMVLNVILEFSCSNYKSIKNKVTFSAIAGKDNTFENELKKFGNYRILRNAVIYGANGSGKSNFLSAIDFMKTLVTRSMTFQPGEVIKQKPHKLNDINTPSEYSIQFVKDNIRYAYGFSIIKNLINNEYLYYFPNGKQVKIFERDVMEIYPGDKFKKIFEISEGVLKGILKENRLFLTCAANFTNIKEIENAFLFFKNDIIVYRPNNNTWTEYSINLMQNDPKVKSVFVKIMKQLDTGISDIKVKIQKVKTNSLDLPQDMPEILKNIILSSPETNQIEAKVIYDQFETDLMTEESTGIKKLFEIICPIIDILNNGKILICDEFETGLHESIVYEIIRLFKTIRQEQFAQLIFSTHDTNLLDSKLFRRDQVWFTQLDKERSTNLYSLVEIKNVRKTENLEREYISGKYGAIPMLNNDINDIN